MKKCIVWSYMCACLCMRSLLRYTGAMRKVQQHENRKVKYLEFKISEQHTSSEVFHTLLFMQLGTPTSKNNTPRNPLN